MKKFILAIIILTDALCLSCNNPTESGEPEQNQSTNVWEDIVYEDFPIQESAHDEEYYPTYVTFMETPFYTYDEDTVFYWQHWDGSWHYFPNLLCGNALRNYDTYLRTGNELFRRRFLRTADRLIYLSKTYNGGAYYVHDFFKTVHRRDTLYSPWYSGLAQGFSICIFLRAFELTGDSAYAEQAHYTFQSMINLRRSNSSWVVFVDSLGYYWSSEYPTEDPPLVLNGFMFAIYGLYDYYFFTRSLESEIVLKAAMTAIKHHIDCWRNPGVISYYSIKTRESNEEYHDYHIRMLRRLGRISGDSFFGAVADSFHSDDPYGH